MNEPQPMPLPDRREQVVQRLSRHFADGELDLAEFERRVDVALRARSAEEVDAVLSDLPSAPPPAPAPKAGAVEGGASPATPARPATGGPAPVPAADGSRDLVLAIMSGPKRQGVWNPAAHTFVYAFWGGAELDFREANLRPGVTELTVVAIMGGVELIVPPGLGIEVGGFAFMGGIDQPRDPGTGGPDAPRLKVKAFAVMGGVQVTRRLPGESPRDARRRLREEARRARHEIRGRGPRRGGHGRLGSGDRDHGRNRLDAGTDQDRGPGPD